jgi:hypothetical protein
MREYSTKIALIKNSRGIYSLDTSIGCNSGMLNESGGCYNDCYAAKSSKLYGYDFSKTVLRDFLDEKHRQKVIAQINKVSLDFIRIGTSGDPSENWEHTINILKKIKSCNKQIVIITKHWTNISDENLEFLKSVNVCLNTSVSALDKPHLIENALLQYNRFKPFCKSLLRIVSCEFNLDSEKGREFDLIQRKLFENDGTIDTILRVSKSNKLIKDGIIKTQKTTFLGKNALVSKFNKGTYFGKCSTCHEMCGLNINPAKKDYPTKSGISKQLKIFKAKFK